MLSGGGSGQVDDATFRELVEPYRRELQLHCYRMLGSFHDAEDALQETLLAAWRGLSSFEGRASIRTWLYRVATTRCLNIHRSRPPRVTAEPGSRHVFGIDLPEPTEYGSVLWLEPYPDSLLGTVPGPEDEYEAQEAISLAFITALQLLPPRQRAVHILREVLGFQAGEVAEMLESTEESVTSALKRARATLQATLASRETAAPPKPRSAAERALVDRFTHAFCSDDIEALIELLTEQVRISMPPLPFEWQGVTVAREVLRAILEPGRRLVGTTANGQPAFGLYLPAAPGAELRAVGMLVLSLSGNQVSGITRFDATVLGSFNLPSTLPA
jgi:RNA polymerase sigma-70 factor (TIGR02960 family)